MDAGKWYLGLDGGGTKTHCVLYNAATGALYSTRAGPTNHEALPGGMSELPGALEGIIGPLLGRAGLTPGELEAAAFGIGGVDMPGQQRAVSEMVSAMGFRRFTVSNDSYLGIKTQSAGWGISAVNGSGYSVTGISRTGEMLQIGGHNDLTGDRGGGSYLVPAAVRAAYAQLFKGGTETAITGALMDWLGVGRREDFCEALAVRLMGDAAGAYRFISRALHTAAAGGDAAALGILEESGRDYAVSISCVARDLGMTGEIPVTLVGSQFTRCECPRAIEVLRAELAERGDFRIGIISTSPAAGALFWAMELAGAAPGEGLRGELRRRLADTEGGAGDG